MADETCGAMITSAGRLYVRCCLPLMHDGEHFAAPTTSGEPPQAPTVDGAGLTLGLKVRIDALKRPEGADEALIAEWDRVADRWLTGIGSDAALLSVGGRLRDRLARQAPKE